MMTKVHFHRDRNYKDFLIANKEAWIELLNTSDETYHSRSGAKFIVEFMIEGIEKYATVNAQMAWDIITKSIQMAQEFDACRIRREDDGTMYRRENFTPEEFEKRFGVKVMNEPDTVHYIMLKVEFERMFADHIDKIESGISLNVCKLDEQNGEDLSVHYEYDGSRYFQEYVEKETLEHYLDNHVEDEYLDEKKLADVRHRLLHVVSPSRMYVVVCSRRDLKGHYFRTFVLPDNELNNSYHAEDYYVNFIDPTAITHGCFGFEDLTRAIAGSAPLNDKKE